MTEREWRVSPLYSICWWHACLALVILLSTASVTSVTLPDILDTVSVGWAGVWGVRGGVVKYMDNTYNDPYYSTSPMGNVSGTAGRMKQLDVGRDIVFGINGHGDTFYRSGFTEAQMKGTEWRRVYGGRLRHVTVSHAGYVWGISYVGNNVYYRYGVTNGNPGGTDWTVIPGNLVQISAGHTGVWGVNATGAVFYRVGTFDGSRIIGTAWTLVDRSLKYISSGDGHVIGVNSEGNIFRRNGITYSNPVGDNWVQIHIEAKLEVVDNYGGIAYGVTKEDKLHYFTI